MVGRRAENALKRRVIECRVSHVRPTLGCIA
jgi:hypothetical protein